MEAIQIVVTMLSLGGFCMLGFTLNATDEKAQRRAARWKEALLQALGAVGANGMNRGDGRGASTQEHGISMLAREEDEPPVSGVSCRARDEVPPSGVQTIMEGALRGMDPERLAQIDEFAAMLGKSREETVLIIAQMGARMAQETAHAQERSTLSESEEEPDAPSSEEEGEGDRETWRSGPPSSGRED